MNINILCQQILSGRAESLSSFLPVLWRQRASCCIFSFTVVVLCTSVRIRRKCTYHTYVLVFYEESVPTFDANLRSELLIAGANAARGNCSL